MHAMLVAVLVLLCTAGLVAELTGSPLDVLDGPQARQSDLEFGEAAPSAEVLPEPTQHLSGPTGDEVVQLYHVPPSGLIVDHPLPIKRLIGFERIHLPAESMPVSVNFNLTTEDFRLTDKAGGQSLYPVSTVR